MKGHEQCHSQHQVRSRSSGSKSSSRTGVGARVEAVAAAAAASGAAAATGIMARAAQGCIHLHACPYMSAFTAGQQLTAQCTPALPYTLHCCQPCTSMHTHINMPVHSLNPSFPSVCPPPCGVHCRPPPPPPVHRHVPWFCCCHVGAAVRVCCLWSRQPAAWSGLPGAHLAAAVVPAGQGDTTQVEARGGGVQVWFHKRGTCGLVGREGGRGGCHCCCCACAAR